EREGDCVASLRGGDGGDRRDYEVIPSVVPAKAGTHTAESLCGAVLSDDDPQSSYGRWLWSRLALRLAGTTLAVDATLPLPAHGLLDLEPLEFRMLEIERLVVAGLVMRGTKRFRLGPRLERGIAGPHGVRGIERVVLGLGPFQQMKLDEARHLVEMGV